MDYAIKILETTDDTIKVGGYGVVFGGKDLQGETFTRDTDFDLDLVPRKPVLYDHGQEGTVKAVRLGHVLKATADEIGLWVEAQLDRANEYADAVLQLVEAGKLGWSSGSVGHMAKRENGIIKSWPIVEFSLTPTPAEPRTVGVQRVKAQVNQQDTAEAKAEQDNGAGVVPDVEKQETKSQGESEMADETTVTAPGIDAIKSAFAEALAPIQERIDKLEAQPITKTAPAFVKGDRGDSEAHEFKAFLRGETSKTEFTIKASNATDMNIGTAADGGNLVPTGFYNQIIERRDETMLAQRLGVMNIPGIGTTVDVPTDNEADGEFVSTNEAATFDLDSPAMSKVSLTLAKYSKYIDVSYELLEDTPTALEAFLANWVGRGLAKTHNAALLTEVGSNGTSLKTFAATAAIAFGEPEDIVGNNDLAPYLEDENGIAWVMRSSTAWDIMSIVGSDRQYGNAMMANGNGRSLLGYPLYFSQKAAAPAVSAKSVYFGNWRYVGFREAPALTFIRDPYTVAVSGQVRLLWHTRFVYKVLQAEAIGYGVQAAS